MCGSHGAESLFAGGLARQSHPHNAGVSALHLLQQLRPVHFRHANIGDNDRARPFFQPEETLGPRRHKLQVPVRPAVRKRTAQPCQDVGFVVYEQYAWFHAASSLGTS